MVTYSRGVTMAHADVETLSHLAAIENDWSESERCQLVIEYEEYLGRASSGSTEAPSIRVDKLWHLHILNSLSYVNYCNERFGHYVHHIACVAPDIVSEMKRRIGRDLPSFMPVVSAPREPN